MQCINHILSFSRWKKGFANEFLLKELRQPLRVLAYEPVGKGFGLRVVGESKAMSGRMANWRAGQNSDQLLSQVFKCPLNLCRINVGGLTTLTTTVVQSRTLLC